MNKILFILLIICFLALLLFNTKQMFQNMTPATAQHNDNIVITKDSYNYIRLYKKQLIQNITNLLNDLNIRFVICWGNLIEYERKIPIFQDDDLDITFNVEDLPKWENFCKNNDKKITKYNLIFDDRFKDIEAQKNNGIQFWLIKLKKKQ